jgi:hypothetical protein
MQSFVDLGLLVPDPNLGALAVAKWDDRQYESDDATKRTRKHRAKNDDGTFHPPPMERSRNGDGTHQSTETDTEPSLGVVSDERSPRTIDAGAPSLSLVPSDFGADLEAARGFPARRALAARMKSSLLGERQVHPRSQGGVFDLIDGYLAVGQEPNELYAALLSAPTLTANCVDVELAKRRQQLTPAARPSVGDDTLAAAERFIARHTS